MEQQYFYFLIEQLHHLFLIFEVRENYIYFAKKKLTSILKKFILTFQSDFVMKKALFLLRFL